ncbi:MAG TPA: GxxExxY protein [Flavobacteriales bacterium]
MKHNEISAEVISAAIEVHRELGPGLLESIYEQCLGEELRSRGLRVDQQVPIPITYKGRPLGTTMRLDMRVEEKLIIEVKAVDELHDVHTAQLLTYLKLTGCKLGLLMNFNSALMKNGVRRVINGIIAD